MSYKCVTTLAELLAYTGAAKTIAFDLETSPAAAHRDIQKAALNANTGDITGVSFSVEATGIYVPLNHKGAVNADTAEILRYLGQLLTDSSIVKIAHNLAFEAMFLSKHGIIPQQPLYCTLAAHQMTLKDKYAFNSLMDSGLKTLAREYFGADMVDFEELTGGKHFDELDPTDAATIQYACADADFALQFYHLFNGWLDKNLPRHRYIVENIESPVAAYTGLMRCNGLLVDRDLMIAKQHEAGAKIAELRNALVDIVGTNVNVGANASTQSLKNYIFVTLGLPVLRKTDKGSPTLDDEALILLSKWCAKNCPELTDLFALIREYRQWMKLQSTFNEGYIKRINPATGRIHPDLLQLGAKSGRFSCTNPNLQNIPNNLPVNIRDFIVAPQDHSVVECDYSQIEARLAAYLSQDDVLLEIYNKGLDLHAMTTAAIYKISLEEASDKGHPLYKKRRTIAKTTFFGFLYGISDTGLSRNLKTSAGIDSSVDECKRFLSNLAMTYKTLSRWQKHTIRTARKNIYSETALGRRCYCPHIRISNYALRGNAERSALNHPVQGLAADLLKIGMSRLLPVIADNPYIKPVLTVHDSLVFYVPDNRIHEAIPLIRNAMETPLPIESFNMPIVADVSVGKAYGSMDEYEPERG